MGRVALLGCAWVLLIASTVLLFVSGVWSVLAGAAATCFAWLAFRRPR